MADADLSLLGCSLKPTYFKNKVVWVTGTSAGIGEELCKQLSRLGVKLILSARSKDKLESLSQSLAHPENSRVLVLDLMDKGSLSEAVNKAREMFGRIDVLVNNAGIAARGKFLDFAEEPAQKLMDVNFLHTVALTKLVLKVMLEQKVGGDVVSIASVSGKGGGSGRHYYGASKAALLSMMDSLRIDFISDNINFINILPGPVSTDITLRALTGIGMKEFNKMDPLIANGMSVERCCQLMLVAISNQVKEAWISTHPFLYLTYLGQYAPSLQFLAMRRRKMMEK